MADPTLGILEFDELKSGEMRGHHCPDDGRRVDRRPIIF